MQKAFCARTRNQFSFVQCLSSNSRPALAPCLARRFATQKPPGFGPNVGGPRAYNPKNPKSGPQDAPEKGHQDANGQSSKLSKRFQSIPKIPIIIIAVSGFILYRLYNYKMNPNRLTLLNNTNFLPFILESRKAVSSTAAILNIYSVPPGQNSTLVNEAWRTGVWSTEVMQPELQIARSYTPLPPVEGAAPEQMRLYVRKEPQGEVSSMLHRIYRGTFVHLRGVRIEYRVPEHVDEVLFLAGGTGIAPALQVAHTLFKYRGGNGRKPRMRVLWANRKREDSYNALEQTQNLLVEEIEGLKSKYAGRFDVEYLVDEDGAFITEDLLRKYLKGREPIAEQSSEDGATGKKILLVSGPEGFIDYYAGSKFMEKGREMQGPLGGMLEKIEPKGWDVWKL